MAVRTLFLVSSILAASTLCAAAVELLNPHDVLNKTRRDMNAFDQRMKGYKAQQQKKEKEAEAKRKNEEAERQKRANAEKALQEAQSRRKKLRNRNERRPRLSKTPNETGSRRTTQTREGGQGSAGGSEEAGCSSRKARPRGFALTSPDYSASILNRRIGTEFDELALKLTTHPQRLRGKAPAYVP